LRPRQSGYTLHDGAQHVAFDALKRLGLCIIKLFAAQYPTPHDRCVRFAAVVAGGHATLARGRRATALPPPDIHRLVSSSFAWRTESFFLSVRPIVLSLARSTMFSLHDRGFQQRQRSPLASFRRRTSCWTKSATCWSS